MLLLTKRRHEISHCRRTFYRQQQLPATLRSVQLLAVRRLNHWIERGMNEGKFTRALSDLSHNI